MPHEFHKPNTRIGQNFLVDRNILRIILDHGNIGPEDSILEVGAGKGILTEGLLERGPKMVFAMEIDRSLEPFLSDLGDLYKNLKIFWGDALKTDFGPGLVPPPNKMIANIPYHITTPLIWKVLELFAPGGLHYLLLMVQKEAADRICAPPRTKERYPLGITLHSMGKTRIIRNVPPEAFRPTPEVNSALVEIILERNFSLPGEYSWRVLLRASFSQRRKTLVNNLAVLFPGKKEDITQFLNRKNIPVSVRAEELETEQWESLHEFVAPWFPEKKRQAAGNRHLPED